MKRIIAGLLLLMFPLGLLAAEVTKPVPKAPSAVTKPVKKSKGKSVKTSKPVTKDASKKASAPPAPVGKK